VYKYQCQIPTSKSYFLDLDVDGRLFFFPEEVDSNILSEVGAELWTLLLTARNILFL
jgi:hypothetical protein